MGRLRSAGREKPEGEKGWFGGYSEKRGGLFHTQNRKLYRTKGEKLRE